MPDQINKQERAVFFEGSADTETNRPEDFRQHRPRDRRHGGDLNNDKDDYIQMELLAEMHANTTNVLGAARRCTP
jgi:hypothetical protein